MDDVLWQNGLPPSLSGVARRRELGLASPRATQQAMHFPESAARRLSIEAILRGHHGCVNRLCWNESGSLLASGSDDRKVMLWSYPDTQRQPICLDTEHQANIFGVRFLPQTGDARLVTGAMDYTVQLHQLDTPPADVSVPVRGASSSRRHPNTAATQASVRSVVYTCHRSRVKDVAVEPLNPHLFWSASEDGTVRQFDTRVPTSQQRDYESRNLLLAVKSKGRYSELKSLNLNPARPHQLAVAASDPLIRIFDRRMLSTGPPDARRAAAAPALALAPPHLALCMAGASSGGRSPRMHATYVAFSNRGDKVVATYHGDHAYCFDITGAAPPPAASSSPSAAAARGQDQQQPFNLFAQPAAAAALAYGPAASSRRRGSSGARRLTNGSNGFAAGSGSMGELPGMLPAAAERAKADGNLHLFSKQYYEAVQKYSEAIRLAPWAPVLYTNQALALLQRGWEGDALCALRDAETAVCLDPASPKAHFRRLQALRAAGMLQSAATAVRLFKRHFPDSAADVQGLEELIAEDVRRQAQQAELRRQQADQRRQLRRRRGMQFDREQRQRRQERLAAARAAAATSAVGAAEDSSAAAEEGGGGGEGGSGAGTSGQPQLSAAATAAAAAATPVQVASGAEAAAAAAASGAPGSPPAAAASGGDSWDESYASASSDEYEEDEEDSAVAAAGAAASSGIDAQYAAALEAAADGGSRSPEQAAASPRAPSLDGVLAASQQQRQQQEAGGGGPGERASASSWRAARQPSLWHAFEGGRRLLQRYVGQCNLQTDIKEAAFLGASDCLVAAGSDDGRVFIFAADTGECLRVITADEDVANAVQPHPHLPVLATSGIESTVKLWSPEGEPTSGGNIADIVRRNQERLKEGPQVLQGVDPRIIAALTDNPELLRVLMQRATRRPGAGQEGDGEGEEEGGDDDEDDEDAVREVTCRVA